MNNKQEATTSVTSSSQPILDEKDLINTIFEPKTVNRFICHMRKKDNSLVIPYYLINSITRPNVTRKNGKWSWNPIQIKTYDPIVPSATQMFYEYLMGETPEKFDITVDVLGPVGDSVEKWEIKNAQIIEVDFGTLTWVNYDPNKKSEVHSLTSAKHYVSSNPMEILATISYEVATLMY